MARSRSVILHDRFGQSLRARLLGGGHIVLREHAHRYTYARLNAAGQVELYDDAGNFSYASVLGEDGDDRNPDDPDTWITAGPSMFVWRRALAFGG